MRVVSFPNRLPLAAVNASGTIAVLLRAAALLLFPLLAAGCIDDTTSPKASVASVDAPAFAIAAPRAPALLVTSVVASEDGVAADERPFRFDGASGIFLGDLQQPVTPTAHREMAFGPDGHLYVVDGIGNAVVRYDGTTGSSLGAFIPAGRGLNNPHGLAFGPEGDLYVTNGSDNRVKQYNGTTGAIVRTYSGLNDAQSITFRGDGIMFVASRGYNDVRRFDRGLNRFVVFVTNGSGGLSQPTTARFGPDGNLYVASYGTGSINRYNGQSGQFIDVFASGGGLVAPGGLVFGPDGKLYVSDFASGSILRFDGVTGAFIDTFVAAGTNGLANPRYLVFSNPPVNNPATIVSGGPYRGLEGSAIAFDASATFDQDGDALRFDWDFGDGSSGTGAAVSHAYDNNGQFTALLTVTDERGAVSTASLSVAIDNAPPSASFGAPESVVEGSTYELMVSGATDPSPGDAEAGFSYAFDCGDGAGYGAVGAATSVVCATTDDGQRSAGVRVVDRDSGESEYLASIRIENAAPELTVLSAPSSTLSLGDAASLRVAYSDRGTTDTHVTSINWGDGTTTTELAADGITSASYTYAASGTYTIIVTVSDDDGASSEVVFSGIQVAGPSGGSDDDSNPPASTKGSIIGGGRIESPPGAHVAQPTQMGWGAFSVVARVTGNGRLPDGSFTFELEGGRFDFASQRFTSLVVDGDHARLTGRGTLNGASGYAFRLTVRDAGNERQTQRTDAVRIRVWEVGSGRVVYDNEIGSSPSAPALVPIAAGSITVQGPGNQVDGTVTQQKRTTGRTYRPGAPDDGAAGSNAGAPGKSGDHRKDGTRGKSGDPTDERGNGKSKKN